MVASLAQSAPLTFADLGVPAPVSSNTGSPAADRDPFALPVSGDLQQDLADLIREAANVIKGPCGPCNKHAETAAGAIVRMVAANLRYRPLREFVDAINARDLADIGPGILPESNGIAQELVLASTLRESEKKRSEVENKLFLAGREISRLNEELVERCRALEKTRRDLIAAGTSPQGQGVWLKGCAICSGSGVSGIDSCCGCPVGDVRRSGFQSGFKYAAEKGHVRVIMPSEGQVIPTAEAIGTAVDAAIRHHFGSGFEPHEMRNIARYVRKGIEPKPKAKRGAATVKAKKGKGAKS